MACEAPVSSISAPFCGDCHRARVSAEGRLYTCLFAGEGTDLRPSLGGSDADVVERLTGLWQARGDRYSELRSGLRSPRKRVEMYLVGG